MKFQKDIKEIIEDIVCNSTTDAAIKRLNGYFKQYYWNNHLRVKLGRLYLVKSDFVNAGKFMYFMENPNEAEMRAINRFKENCQNNKLKIFSSIVNKSRIPRGIESNMSEKIFSLILGVSEQEGSLPTEIVRWIYSYNRIRNIEIELGYNKKNNFK